MSEPMISLELTGAGEVCIFQVTDSKLESRLGQEGVNAPVGFQSISNDLATGIKSRGCFDLSHAVHGEESAGLECEPYSQIFSPSTFLSDKLFLQSFP